MANHKATGPQWSQLRGGMGYIAPRSMSQGDEVQVKYGALTMEETPDGLCVPRITQA